MPRDQEIASLMRAFERGGGYLELQKIIRRLEELEASSALRAIAEDRSIPPALGIDVLAAIAACHRAPTAPPPDDETIALFLSELNASSRRRKHIAIEALGQWRVHKAIAQLSLLFRRQKQTALRSVLLEALARIAAPDTLFLVQQWLLEAPAHQLAEELPRCAQIPRIALRDVLQQCQQQRKSDATVDGAIDVSALFSEAIAALDLCLQEHQQTQLSPYRQQLEEGLF